MSHAALTAKYRPQTFAEIAGQETLKAILSRASLEQRVAPAYLFSGTRGVGKTTLARIFAKALNCRAAPAAEPCNQCDQCRAITAGSAVDVVEIDGASNRGIDDVRRLKEVVGYAPMEGAYKIFIIDEAHMLSREAFNALLKTLEEPPARVTFIMATTEPHKFPATIISRCQHYVFKRLPEKGLVDHLCSVLERERVDFDAGAVRLIARRGAGSIRDSMSLLGQVLALQEGRLSEEAARSVLGLVGQEAFLRMLDAFRDDDGLALSRMLREMLDHGLDISFFLRELSSLWRNLFMLRQSGPAALEVVDLPEDEAGAYLKVSSGFSLQHIHASWQMTLEGQRRVLTSLEPALALELLLLNLAMLPRLLSLENVSALARRPGLGDTPAGGPATGSGGGTGFVGMPEGGRPGGYANTAPGPINMVASGPATDRMRGAAQAVGGGDRSPQPSRAGARDARNSEPEPPERPALVTPPAGSPSGDCARATSVTGEQGADARGTGDARLTSATLSEEDGQEDEAAIQEAYAELSRLSHPPTDSPDGSSGALLAVPANGPSDGSLPDAEAGFMRLLARSYPQPVARPGLLEDTPSSARAEPPLRQVADHGLPAADGVVVAPAEPGPEEGQTVVPKPTTGTSEPLPDWSVVFRVCADLDAPPWLTSLLRRVGARDSDGTLVLTADDAFVAERLRNTEVREQLKPVLEVWCGRVPPVRILASGKGRKSREELKAEVLEHPLVKEVESRFGAYVVDYGQLR